MKNASTFNFLFKCEFGLNTFFALACIIALVNSSLLSPLIVLAFSFDFTKMASPQRNDNERSPSQRRALVNATPSARQLVEPSARRKPIQRNGSVNPHKRFWQSPHKVQIIRTDVFYYLLPFILD